MDFSRDRSPSTSSRDITWEEVGCWCDRIAKHVDDNLLDIRVVAGVRRGGVIPGTIIAYRLGKQFKEVEDPYDLTDFMPSRVLLIDDVVDTGLTFSRFKIGLHEKFYTAALVGKPWVGRLTGDVIQPDFIAEWLTEWAVFPWER